MSQNYPSINAACGAVTGGTGVAIWAAGAATARTGAGVYPITLDQGCDSAESSVRVTPRKATFASATVVHTSDTVKTVHTFNAAGVATDSDFDFLVTKAPLS